MDDMTKVIEKYYANNASKLRKMVDKIIKKFGGLSQKDIDEFYSLANQVFWIAAKDFNGCGNFNGFLYSRLSLKIMSMMTERNRQKRSDIQTVIHENGMVEKIFHQTWSLDATIQDDDHTTLGEVVESQFDIFDEISGLSCSENVIEYMDRLTPIQKEIAQLMMDGYSKSDIQKKLNISEKRYIKLLSNMKSFEKTRYLRKSNKTNRKRDIKMEQLTTLETNKDDKLSLASIIKRIDNCTIRFDHPLQRSSEQWTKLMKGNLISDILQGNPLPEIVLAEQVINNLGLIWDIDGKQRCTNVHSYKNDEFKVDKKVRRPIISYQAIMRDENKRPILDEKGFPQSERRTFDIRNKKFSDLPEELQDKFLDYDFKIVQYFNCTSEDIAYHIERYNSGRPMNASQKGLTRIGQAFAEMAKNISAMSFFTELAGYKVSESKNGTLDRVVIESIMTINFLDHWIKDQGDMCAFLKENANEDMFDELEELVERLTNIGNEEFFNIFDSKNSFVYFAAFHEFLKFNLEDNKFVEFMIEFENELHSKKIKEISFDDLNGKSTKDKNIVIGKVNQLKNLMKEYFHIDDKKEVEDKNESILEFINKNVDEKFKAEDIELFEDIFNDYTVNIDNNSPLLCQENRKSFLALTAYAFLNELDNDMEEWMIQYFEKYKSFISDQKENYLHMKKNLDSYIQLKEKKVG